jgi:hypothetical protein
MREQIPIEEILNRLLSILWAPQNVSLPPSIPWPEVVELARINDVRSLLHAAIRQASIEVPQPIQEDLRRIYYQTAATNLVRFEVLGQTLAALSAVNTPLLLLKGPALAETVYGNVALRVMGDADLTVPVERVPECRQVLLELGYSPTEVEPVPGAQTAYRNEEAFTHTEPEHMTIELHWHLLDIPYYLRKVPMTWFWKHTDALKVARKPVRILNPTANMLYLPAHLAFHHRFHGLRWYVDLAFLVHREGKRLDWSEIARRAREFELVLVLRETMDRLAGYWPSLPLDEPRRRLHALQPTSFERRLFRLLTTEPRSPFLDFYSDIVCLPDLHARARFILLNTFPRRPYMERRYGVTEPWKLPYWYLHRLGAGLIKLARTLPQAARLR